MDEQMSDDLGSRGWMWGYLIMDTCLFFSLR